MTMKLLNKNQILMTKEDADNIGDELMIEYFEETPEVTETIINKNECTEDVWNNYLREVK